MKILIDTREQAPFSFCGYDAHPELATLSTGDYSLPGFEDRAGIERKSLEDLVSCLMGSNRDRFERELARGQSYELFAVVVEAALSDVSRGKYKSDMKPHAALQSLIAFQVRYRVPFIWCGSRAAAEYYTFWTLAKYLREISERYRQAMKGQEPKRKEKAA